jgi:hypothetical protein
MEARRGNVIFNVSDSAPATTVADYLSQYLESGEINWNGTTPDAFVEVKAHHEKIGARTP